MSFISDGSAHAVTFHTYAHKQIMVVPDWAGADWWSRHAKELIVNISQTVEEIA